jgi:hypothetical protein
MSLDRPITLPNIASRFTVDNDVKQNIYEKHENLCNHWVGGREGCEGENGSSGNETEIRPKRSFAAGHAAGGLRIGLALLLCKVFCGAFVPKRIKGHKYSANVLCDNSGYSFEKRKSFDGCVNTAIEGKVTVTV